MTSHNHHQLQQQQQLIPGLPNSDVLDCLLPRLPWHTRPRMRSVSKAWKEVLDHNLAPYAALTRQYCRLQHGLVIVYKIWGDLIDEKVRSMMPEGLFAWPPYYLLSIYDDESKRWRLLPPIPALHYPLKIPAHCGVASADRKLYVMGGSNVNFEEARAEVHMLDLGSGAWQWERRSNMRVPRFSPACLSVAGKIYVFDGAIGEVAPEAYHVDRDHWSLLPPVNTEGFHAKDFVAAGQQVIAVDFIVNDDFIVNNDISTAWKVYNPVAKLWSDWDFDHITGSDYLGGFYELRDGIVYRLDNSSKQLWTAFKSLTKTWEEREEIWAAIDSSYLFVIESSKTHVYCLIWSRIRSTLWRGDMDNELRTVAWREMELPDDFYYLSGNMCHFH